MSIKYDDSHLIPIFRQKDLNNFRPQTVKSLNLLINRNGAGNDFLGWLDLPNQNVNELTNLIEV